jgi:Gram-negative bacterial TonB protein C-terminal
MSLRPSAVLFTVFLALSPISRPQAIPVAVQNDPGGFSKQYKQIFDNYTKENYSGMTAAFQSFKLPPEWFVETFGAESGRKLAQQYEHEFTSFVTETESLYGPLNTALVNFVETRRHKLSLAKSVGSKPAPLGLKTIPPIQFFDVDYGRNQALKDDVFARLPNSSIPGQAPGGLISGQSWSNKSTGTFVYLDGAFRFFGPGIQPFWETADDQADENCRGTALVTPIVSMRVFPLLPKKAEKLQVRRTVRVKTRVAPNGRVIEAEPIEGDPMLIGAALAAARAWRYFPPLSKCGQPAEAVGYETVAFVPPQ